MYYIYHIKGVKWGCSKELKQRLRNQGYSFCDLEDIIAVLDKDEATQLEIELNKKYGYKQDCIPYTQTIINQSKSSKKRLLTNEQLQVIKECHWPSNNQHHIPIGKKTTGQLATEFGVDKQVIVRAIKKYI